MCVSDNNKRYSSSLTEDLYVDTVTTLAHELGHGYALYNSFRK